VAARSFIDLLVKGSDRVTGEGFSDLALTEQEGKGSYGGATLARTLSSNYIPSIGLGFGPDTLLLYLSEILSDAEGVGSLQSERHVNRSKTLRVMAEKEWS